MSLASDEWRNEMNKEMKYYECPGHFRIMILVHTRKRIENGYKEIEITEAARLGGFVCAAWEQRFKKDCYVAGAREAKLKLVRNHVFKVVLGFHRNHHHPRSRRLCEEVEEHSAWCWWRTVSPSLALIFFSFPLLSAPYITHFQGKSSYTINGLRTSSTTPFNTDQR